MSVIPIHLIRVSLKIYIHMSWLSALLSLLGTMKKVEQVDPENSYPMEIGQWERMCMKEGMKLSASTVEATDHFFKECKEKKETQSDESYEALYKKLMEHWEKENISLPKSLIVKKKR